MRLFGQAPEKPKEAAKKYASGRQRRGQILKRRPINERPSEIDVRLEVGY